MKVIECLKGGFKKDDVISVTWKNVLDKVSCPHMIPFQGKCGWWLNRDKGNKNIYVLGGGFLSLDQAKEQKAKFEKAQMEKNQMKGQE